MEVLKKMNDPPKYILLENVQGFEDSQTYASFNEILNDLDYNQQGFLISPKHLKIPNSRLRCVLITCAVTNVCTSYVLL